MSIWNILQRINLLLTLWRVSLFLFLYFIEPVVYLVCLSITSERNSMLWHEKFVPWNSRSHGNFLTCLTGVTLIPSTITSTRVISSMRLLTSSPIHARIRCTFINIWNVRDKLVFVLLQITGFILNSCLNFSLCPRQFDNSSAKHNFKIYSPTSQWGPDHPVAHVQL